MYTKIPVQRRLFQRQKLCCFSLELSNSFPELGRLSISLLLFLLLVNLHCVVNICDVLSTYIPYCVVMQWVRSADFWRQPLRVHSGVVFCHSRRLKAARLMPHCFGMLLLFLRLILFKHSCTVPRLALLSSLCVLLLPVSYWILHHPVVFVEWRMVTTAAAAQKCAVYLCLSLLGIGKR